jgi:hypothetical protein
MQLWKQVSPWWTAAATVSCALSLLAPWGRSGRVDRSSVELLASAGALEFLSPTEHLLLVGAWFLIFVGAAGAVVAAAWRSPRLVAASAAPMGPAMVLAWWAVGVSPLQTRWGATVGLVVGLTATAMAILLLIEWSRPAEGT